MAVYAIGDIQGCHDQLRELLAKVGFDPAHDTGYPHGAISRSNEIDGCRTTNCTANPGKSGAKPHSWGTRNRGDCRCTLRPDPA